jgi:tRNA splicing ligase
MDQHNTELTSDWLNYAKASLDSRIQHTGEATEKVLAAVQAISLQLDDKKDLGALMSLKSGQTSTAEILHLLRDVLDHLDAQDELAQLIAPLFSTLQFEDRTRQKLESILGILSIWAEVRNEDITDQDLSSRLMQHVVSMEQQAILAKYFPDYIQEEEIEDDIDLF